MVTALHVGWRHVLFANWPIDPEILDLTERYRYYTEAQDGSIRYAAIDHDPWSLYEAALAIESNTLFEANGFAHPETEPVHYYSPGVRTFASPNRRV